MSAPYTSADNRAKREATAERNRQSRLVKFLGGLDDGDNEPLEKFGFDSPTRRPK